MDDKTKLQIALDAINNDQLEVTPAALVALKNDDIHNFVVASTPGGIEAQEAGGQADFVESQTLPIDCPKEQLETLGFVFGDTVDELFVNVKFPEGWTVRPTDHSMWSELLDQHQNVRAAIFYKAAFYDRSAHMRLGRAILVEQNYDAKDGIQFFVTYNRNKNLFSTEIVQDVEKDSKEYWAEEDRMRNVAIDWMNKNYPDNDNPLAYWEPKQDVK